MADPKTSKEELDALRVKAAAAKVAAIEAKTAQEAVAAASKASAAQQVADAKAVAAAQSASSQAAVADAKARIDGMAAIGKMINDKRLADAKAASEAKAAADSAKARALAEKSDRAAAKAAGDGHAAVAKKAAESAEAVQNQTKAVEDGMKSATMFSTALGMAASAAQVAVSAVIALTVAVIAGTVALTQYAIACADAARSQRLLDNAAAGTTARGSELNKVISDVASRVPIAREKVSEFGRALEIAGISGARMQTALEMIAAIESAIPGAGGKVQDLVERFQRLRRATLNRADLVGTGLAIEDIAAQVSKATGMAQAAAIAALQNGTLGVDKTLDYMRKAIEAKFGKTIALQMMSLTTQFDKLKANMALLFDGIDLEPLLAGLKTVTDLFSQNTVTGRALKAVMSLIFQPVADGLAKLAPFARQFFIGFVVGILRMYVALKPLIVGIGQLLGMGGKGDGLKTAFLMGKAAVALMADVLQYLLSAITAVIVAVKVMGAAWDWIKDAYAKIDGLGKYLAGLPATALEAGTNFVMSFVNAITQGIVAAVAAVMQLGAAAGAALKASLGIASPSKVAVGAAENVTTSFADTVEDGTGDTQAAFKGMVKPSDAKGVAKGAKAAGGGKVVYIENLTIGSREDFAAFRAMLRGEFEFEGAS